MLAALLVLVPAPGAMAQIEAGEVLMTRGMATAASPEGVVRALGRGSPVFSGDTLVTGPDSYLRVGYTDGGFLMLRPESRFLVERYRDEPAGQGGSAFFRLLRGGARLVTGLIAKVNRRRFRLATPLATIGIRGTDFSVRICARDCDDVFPPAPDGLVVALHSSEGIVVTSLAGRSLEVTAPETYALVATPGSFPRLVGPEEARALTQDPIPSADPLECR